MGYSEALEAAGAEVIKFEQFGSYQGNWYALIKYKGKTGFVSGSYGSCGGCDAFEGEFGWNDADNDDKLKQFGMSYLDEVSSYEDTLKKVSKNIEWDSNALEMIAWVKSTYKVFFNKEFSDKLDKEVND